MFFSTKKDIINNDIIDSSYTNIDNRIFKIGGFNKLEKCLSNIIFEYIPGKDNAFREISKLPIYLKLAGSFIYKDRMYVVCGFDNTGKSTKKVFSINLSDLLAGVWKEEADFPTNTYSPRFVTIDNKVYAIGNGYTLNDKGDNTIYTATIVNDKLVWSSFTKLGGYYKDSSIFTRNKLLYIGSGTINNGVNQYILGNSNDSRTIFSRVAIFNLNSFSYKLIYFKKEVIKLLGVGYIRNAANSPSKNSLVSNNKLYMLDRLGLLQELSSWKKLKGNYFTATDAEIIIVENKLYLFEPKVFDEPLQHTIVLEYEE